MKVQTGDIALYRGAGPFGRLIRWWTKSDINHAALIVRKRGGRLHKRHSAKGWIFRRSFIEEPFKLGEKGLVYIVRVRAGIVRIGTVRRRSDTLLDKVTPYDWRAVVGVALGPLGKYVGHSKRRFMCSEAVSWCWRPNGQSIFADKPHDDISPADILNSPVTEVIWKTPL